MEFQQVLGIRRSIRYYEPDKPVEPEKIQDELGQGFGGWT